jgi:diaminohydroxyphosphoribosylaminopyrimidine deaminase/5-amino-6-(5-phosphoribosylamino)uracil reductase
MRDPNPLVSGRGISRLRRAGVHVTVDCLREEAERLNEMYGHWMRTGRPFVILKAAMTLDGKIAAASGESRWITGEAARRHAHRLRSEMDAVMVGIGTVLRDDPQLTVRLGDRRSRTPRLRQPLRVVVDSTLRISPAARVLSPGAPTDPRSGVVVATTARAPRTRIERLRAKGVSVVVLPAQHGRVSLRACLIRLGQMGITSLLLEGGGELNASALRAGLVSRVLLYVAPTLLGGRDAKGVIGGQAPQRLAGALPVTDLRTQWIGRDLLVEATLSPKGG